MVVEKIWDIKSQLQETRAVQVAEILALSIAAAADGSHPLDWEPFARMPQIIPGAQINKAEHLTQKICAAVKDMPSRYLRRSLTQVGVAQRHYAAIKAAAMKPPTAAMTSPAPPMKAPPMKPVLPAVERPAPT
jgi:hypothetical protein